MTTAGTANALGRSMGLGITVSPGPTEIQAYLERIAAELQDFRPAWQRIAREIILPALRQAFSSASSPDGQAWAPLSARYLAEKEKRFPGAGTQPGVASGKLLDALTREGSGGGALRSFGAKSARIGTSLAYALPMQWGYGAGSVAAARAAQHGGPLRKTRSLGLRSAVPARSFIAWSSEMSDRALDILITHLQDLVDKTEVEGLTPAGAG